MSRATTAVVLRMAAVLTRPPACLRPLPLFTSPSLFPLLHLQPPASPSFQLFLVLGCYAVAGVVVEPTHSLTLAMMHRGHHRNVNI